MARRRRARCPPRGLAIGYFRGSRRFGERGERGERGEGRGFGRMAMRGNGGGRIGRR